MAEPTLEFIGKQLGTIQAELRDIKFAADLDRRNTRTLFDNLATEVGAALGLFEVKVNDRLDTLTGQAKTLTGQFDQVRAQLNRIEALIAARTRNHDN